MEKTTVVVQVDHIIVEIGSVTTLTMGSLDGGFESEFRPYGII